MATLVDCKCHRCGIEFKRELGEYNHNKGILKAPQYDFCSPECFIAFRQKDNIIVKCEICGKDIVKTPSKYKQNKSKKFYCNDCRCSVNMICPICGKTFKKWKSQVKGKKNVFCSKECKAISQRKDWNDLDRGYVKNRWIRDFGEDSLVCNRCGHDKIYNIELHHIIYVCNGGTHDIENLEPLCKNCHGTEHYGSKDTSE